VGEIFRTYPDLLRGLPSLLYNGYRVLPGGTGSRGVMLTTHPLLVPRLKRVELYLHLAYGSSWACHAFPFTFTSRSHKLRIPCHDDTAGAPAVPKRSIYVHYRKSSHGPTYPLTCLIYNFTTRACTRHHICSTNDELFHNLAHLRTHT